MAKKEKGIDRFFDDEETVKENIKKATIEVAKNLEKDELQRFRKEIRTILKKYEKQNPPPTPGEDSKK